MSLILELIVIIIAVGLIFVLPGNCSLINPGACTDNSEGSSVDTSCEHEYGDWEDKTQAGCVTSGESIHYCKKCDFFETKKIPALGHIPLGMAIVKEPTCINSGKKENKCDRCGEIIESEIIPATGHDYRDGVCSLCGESEPQCEHGNTEWKIVSEPSCVQTGKKENKCVQCGVVLRTEEIPSLGHNPLGLITVEAPTCVKTGKKENKCERCGEILENEIIPELGHNPLGLRIVEVPTCVKTGKKENKCERCGKITESEIIPELGHDCVNGKCIRCGVIGESYTRIGNYIYFGSYPQSEVTDSITLNALSEYVGELPENGNDRDWTDCDYYAEGTDLTSFMWYKDVLCGGKKYRAVYFTSYRPRRCHLRGSEVNSPQYDNGYNKGTVYWFNFEPIKWQILAESENSAFLMSTAAIDAQQFYHTENGNSRFVNGKIAYENNYEESEIRTWLNLTFYKTAFSSLQQSLIKSSVIDNRLRSTRDDSNVYLCENTYDKIFLLSVSEATSGMYGFNEDCSYADSKRSVISSDYAKSQGCWQGANEAADYCQWWLRSPNGEYSIFVKNIDEKGNIMTRGVCSASLGVVPALWLNLDSESSIGETYTRHGDYVYFGNYPQSKVTDVSVISMLDEQIGYLPTNYDNYGWIDCKYFADGVNSTSFMWYKDVYCGGEKYRAVFFTSYRPYWCSGKSAPGNTYQDDNGYKTGKVYWFKFEPIKWKILTENDGSVLLMCCIAIDSREYYHTANNDTRNVNGKLVYENNYAESEIHYWLNQSFYNAAFSNAQKSLIKTTLVNNEAISTNPHKNPTLWNNGVNKYVCENTNDKVFLLSYAEVTNKSYGFGPYDSESVARRVVCSDYAKSQGCLQNAEKGYVGTNFWWLRSPCYNDSSCAAGVRSCGDVIRGNNVDIASAGVVPALWLELEGKEALSAR